MSRDLWRVGWWSGVFQVKVVQVRRRKGGRKEEGGSKTDNASDPCAIGCADSDNACHVDPWVSRWRGRFGRGGRDEGEGVCEGDEEGV